MSLLTRSHVPLLLAAALAAAVPGTAQAATILVDTFLDADAADGFCSLREAILAANSDAVHNECPAGDGPDRILFALTTPAEINLIADLPTITETLLIRGPGALQLILDGADLHRLLSFDTAAGGWLGVERLALYRGRSPAGGDGGGANVAAGETAFFHRVFFVENHSDNSGGGLAVSSTTSAATTATILECLFQSNVAEGPGSGGGLALVGTGGEVRVIRSTFFDNEAAHEGGSGGAIFASRGTVVLDASTVSGNRANSSGGGILLQVTGAAGVSGALTVRDSTITENVANADGDPSGDGGGIAAAVGVGFQGTLELHNSVVAGNLDSGSQTLPDLQCSSSLQLLASGASFIGANEGCAQLFPAGSPNPAGDYVGTAAAPLDPALDPLADNGGPTPTHRPSPPFVPPLGELGPTASPLIDYGSCPDVIADQRGYGDAAAGLRRFDQPDVPNPPAGDGCDIGAVEVGADPRVDRTIFADGFEAGHTLLWSSEVP